MKKILALLGLLWASPALATTYYVNSAGGSDSNNGTSTSTPWATIGKAATTMVGGDTTNVAPGNGYSGQVTITTSGSTNNPITYQGMPGQAKPVIHPGNVYQAFEINASWITIQGFDIEGNTPNTTLANCQSNGTTAACSESAITIGQVSNIPSFIPTHIVISNNIMAFNSQAGVTSIGGDYITVSGNIVHDNCNFSSFGGSGISIGYARNSDGSTAIKNFVTGNTLYNNVELVPEPACGNNICDGEGIILDDFSNDQTDNTIYTGGTLVENNLSYSNGSVGILVFDSGSAAHFQFLYNTTYNNGSSNFNKGEINALQAQNLIAENNVMYARGSGFYTEGSTSSSNITYDYNVLFNGSSSVSGAHDISANPQFVSVGSNFALAATSPAIGAATSAFTVSTDIAGDVRPNPTTGLYDIGAYQYVSPTPAPSPSTVSRAADFLNMISVQGGISGGGAPYINATQQVADLQYLGIGHYRDGLNIALTGGTAPVPLGIYAGQVGQGASGSYPGFDPQWDGFVSVMGRTPTLMLTYMDQTHGAPNNATFDWIGQGGFFSGLMAGDARTVHTIPVIGMPFGSSTGGQFFSGLSAGTYDAEIQGLLGAWKANGYSTLVIRPAWEFNLPGNYGVTTSNLSSFIAAWTHVYGVIHTYASANGMNVTVVWNPNVGPNQVTGGTTLTVAQQYPGDSWVDAYGIDTYGAPIGSVQPNATTSDPTLYYVSTMFNMAQTSGKPVFFGEVGGIDNTFANNMITALTTSGLTHGVQILGFDMWDVDDPDSGNLSWTNPSDGQSTLAAIWVGGFGPSGTVHNSASSNPALQALASNGITMDAQVPYGTVLPATQIATLQQWQALAPNFVYSVEGINEPGIGTVTYLGTTGGEGLTWKPVADYMIAYYTSVQATPSLASLPFFGVSRVGEETNNVGLQYVQIPNPLPSGVIEPAGSIMTQYATQHVYPMDQVFLQGGVKAACQPNDPSAGNAYNIDLHWNFVQTFVAGFAGYTSDAAAQAQPRTTTEFGYATTGPAPSANGDRVNEDKKGRCILNGLLTGWQLGMKMVSIYDLYDLSGDGFGLMAGSGTPNLSGTYLHNFTSVLSDTSNTARTFTTTPLSVGFTGLCSACSEQVLQKSNGHYEVTIWSNATNWNVAAGTPITVAATTVGVHFPSSGTITVYDPTVGTTPVSSAVNTANASVAVADYPIIVDFVPGSQTISANNTTVLAGSNQTITDSNLNVWAITSGAQVTLSGVVIGYTANVVEIAYVNSVVWQLNSAGDWYSFTSTGAIGIGPTTTSPLPQSNFSISGGNIITPSGAVFNGRGFAIHEVQIGGAVTSANGNPMTGPGGLFPKLNFVRLGVNLETSSCVYNFNQFPPSYFQSFVNTLTSLGVVVIMENLAFPQSCSVQTGSQLTAEVAWYVALAQAFVNNPFVWYETPNEPLVNNEVGSQAAVTSEQVAIYNGIRGAGNNSIIALELVAGGQTQVLGINCSSGACLSPASAYATMTNVIWDLHQYSEDWGGQNALVSAATMLADMQGSVALAQQITSANGTVPVIIGEYGNSTDGANLDTSGANMVTAVQSSSYSTQAFEYSSGTALNNLTNGSNSGLSNPFGTVTEAYIAAGGGVVTPKPVVTAPATLTATIATATSVGSVTATDPVNPSDTISFAGTSNGSGLLSATGATGNGSNTITFTGSLTAVNTLMGTIVFTDSVMENPTLNFTIQDQHSLTGSATTAVTVTGGVSPNCTIVTTVGPTITSIGPPSATWSISSGGQVVVNGTPDTTTANVIELAYVSGVVWQANTSNNWYSKTTPASAWTGPTTVNPTTGCTASTLAVTAPTTLAAIAGASTPVPGISAADQNFPLDTMNLTISASAGTTLSATGAAGNGTATITFSGTLSALNTLLSKTFIIATNGASATVVNNSGGSLKDPSGNTWTVTGGVIQENGANAAFSANVTAIYLVNGTVYQVNASSQWYFWNGTGWTASNTGSPLVSTSTLTYTVTDQHSGRATAMTTVTINSSLASPNFTITRSVGVGITDVAGEVFAINSSGQITVNGVVDSTTSNVVEIGYINGNIWQENASNQWFFKANAAATWSGVEPSPVNKPTPIHRR